MVNVLRTSALSLYHIFPKARWCPIMSPHFLTG